MIALMDMGNDSLSDLTPLEQRRARLRAFADRMLIQIYTRITRQQQINPSDAPPPLRSPFASAYQATPRPSAQAYPHTPQRDEDAETAPFAYNFDDDEIDDDPQAQDPEEAPEPLSPLAQAALELERRANAILEGFQTEAHPKGSNDPP